MTTRGLNREKKWRRCLKCGRKMWTDRCHRLCLRCREENHNQFERKVLQLAWVSRGRPERDSDDADADAELDLMGIADVLDGS